MSMYPWAITLSTLHNTTTKHSVVDDQMCQPLLSTVSPRSVVVHGRAHCGGGPNPIVLPRTTHAQTHSHLSPPGQAGGVRRIATAIQQLQWLWSRVSGGRWKCHPIAFEMISVGCFPNPLLTSVGTHSLRRHILLS